jgi:hypothetical protein
MNLYSKEKIGDDFLELLQGIDNARRMMAISNVEFDDLKQEIVSSYLEAKKRGKETGERCAVGKNGEPIRSVEDWGFIAAKQQYKKLQKEYEYKKKEVNFEKIEQMSKSIESELPINLNDEHDDFWGRIDGEEDVEVEILPPSNTKSRHQHQQIKVPHGKHSHDSKLKDEEREGIINTRQALEDAYSNALKFFDDQQMKLFSQEFANIPCWEYVKRKNLVKEKDGKFKLDKNGFLLRALWHLIGDELFEIVMSLLSGHEICIPKLEAQTDAMRKNMIYDACSMHDEQKLKYKDRELKTAGLLQTRENIGEGARHRFIKRTEFLKHKIGLTFIGEDPKQLDGHRVSQIYKEEKELRKKHDKYMESMRVPETDIQPETIIGRRKLAQLVFLSLKQARNLVKN